MIVAIPLANNEGMDSVISEHFGHAPYFGFVDIDGSNSFTVEIKENPLLSHNPGDIPSYIKQNNASVIIVRGIGGRAIGYFNEYGIKVIRGAEGKLKEIIEAFIDNKLFDTEYSVKSHGECH